MATFWDPAGWASAVVEAGGISWGWAFVLARATGLAWTAPGLGSMFPGSGWRLRVGMAALLAGAIGPMVAGEIPIDPAGPSLAGLVGALVVEAVVGAAIGLAAGLIVSAARQAGELVGAQAGLAPAALLAPESDGGPLNPLGHLYGWLALAVFAALDGPLRLVSALAESYGTVPAGGGLVGGPRPDWPVGPEAATELAAEGFARVGRAAELAVRAAAPAGLALVVVGLALAWIGRRGSSSPAGALAWPARSVAGLTLALLGLGALAALLADAWPVALGGD